MSTGTKPDLRVRIAPREGASASAPIPVAVATRTIVLFVAIALGALVLLALAYAARSILTQFVAAIVLAMAAEPLVQAFERRGLSRGQAVGVSFGLLVAVLVAFGYLLLTPLVDQSTRFIHNAPRPRSSTSSAAETAGSAFSNGVSRSSSGRTMCSGRAELERPQARPGPPSALWCTPEAPSSSSSS